MAARQALHIAQAGDSHFDWHSDGQAGCTRGRLQQNSDLVTGIDQLTGEDTTDKAGATGEQDHQGRL